MKAGRIHGAWFPAAVTGLVLGVAAVQAPASAQEKEIQSTGVGTIYGTDKAAARDRAIEDAQRKAVEQAVGTMVSSETVTENYALVSDKIFAQSKGYISNYRVVNEGPKEGEYQVTIVAKVKLGDLTKDVDGIKALFQRMGKPKVMLMIAEQSVLAEGGTPEAAVLSATSLGVTENELMAYFMKKGFEFVDRQVIAGKLTAADPIKLVSDPKQVMEITKQTEAQVVIFGSAIARNAGKVPDTAFFSGQANISIRAVRTDSGQVIASANANGAFPHIDPNTANQKALIKATTTIAGKIEQQILEKWTAETSGARMVSLSVKGVKYGDVKEFKNWLPKYVRGVKDVNQRGFADGVAKFDLDLQGDAQKLADEMADKKFANKSIEVVNVSPNMVTIEIK